MKPSLSASKLHRLLRKRVQFLLDLLCEVEKYPALYTNQRTLRVALRRYEHVWVPLLVKGTQLGLNVKRLAPPLDVQWVWAVHMLCPKKYAPDSQSMWAAAHPAGERRIIDHMLMSHRQRKRALNKTRRLWSTYFAHEPFENTYMNDGLLCEDEQHKEQLNAGSSISYDVIAACERQMMFHRHVAILPQYRHHNFIHDAVTRYYMFLELKLKHKQTVLVPTFDTDIVWHTHMMHPINYREHTLNVCKFVVPHDDTISDREDGADLHESWHQTLRLWYAHFKTPFWRAGAMGRDNVTLEERVMKGRICEAARQFERDLQRNWNGEALVVRAITFDGSVEDRAEWSNVEWVHAAQQRRLSASNSRRSGRVEQWSSLESSSTSCSTARMYARTVRQYETQSSKGTAGARSTMVEIFKHDAKGRDNILALPLAAAYDVATNSMCVTSRAKPAYNECALRTDEKALVVRVCGEDYAIVAAAHDARGGIQIRVWFLNQRRPRWRGARRENGAHAMYVAVQHGGKRAACSVELRNGCCHTDGARVLAKHHAVVLHAFALASAAAALRGALVNG